MIALIVGLALLAAAVALMAAAFTFALIADWNARQALSSPGSWLRPDTLDAYARRARERREPEPARVTLVETPPEMARAVDDVRAAVLSSVLNDVAEDEAPHYE